MYSKIGISVLEISWSARIVVKIQTAFIGISLRQRLD